MQILVIMCSPWTTMYRFPNRAASMSVPVEGGPEEKPDARPGPAEAEEGPRRLASWVGLTRLLGLCRAWTNAEHLGDDVQHATPWSRGAIRATTTTCPIGKVHLTPL
eukprot:scaffold6450_cov415-Prasinococcus_capsulatus_cf.AAC.8